MNPSSLRELCVQNVARHLAQGFYKYDKTKLDQEMSNEVFEMHTRRREILTKEERKQLDETLKETLLSSKMFLYAEREADLSLVRNQKLEELEVKIGLEFEDDRIENDAGPPNKKPRVESRIDVVLLLANNLTPESHRLLKTLVLTSFQGRGFPIARGWAQPMSQLLPSLTTLKLYSEMIDDEAFGSMCENFPRLLVLDISRTKVTSLRGISNISYLHELSIGGSNDIKDIDEIYELRTLKNLRMRCTVHNSEMYDSLKSFINSERTLVALQLLDCSKSSINGQSLKKIEARHPTLREVIVTGNDLIGYSPDNSRVKVISDDTFPACFNALEYFEKKTYHNGIDAVLQEISEKLEAPVNELEKRWLQQLVRKLYQMIPKYEADFLIDMSITECCGDLVCEALLENVLDNGDKRVLIECFLRLIESQKIAEGSHVSYLWELMNEVIEKTQTPQTDRLISVAFKWFVLTDNEECKLSCLKTIEYLLDKMNLQSDFYKKLDREKLIIELKKILPDVPDFQDVIEKLMKRLEANDELQ